jgi:hypothetical protein
MDSDIMIIQYLASVDRPGTPPLPLSPRLRSQLVYFMTPPDTRGLPEIGEDEYWISRADVTKWIVEGVIDLISPLDTEKISEVELTEEQETLLDWLDRYQTQHVRVIE